jgi:hypothetical protein
VAETFLAVSGIQYSLKESEILEDLNYIQKLSKGTSSILFHFYFFSVLFSVELLLMKVLLPTGQM